MYLSHYFINIFHVIKVKLNPTFRSIKSKNEIIAHDSQQTILLR
jgi:hypothetical protein